MQDIPCFADISWMGQLQKWKNSLIRLEKGWKIKLGEEEANLRQRIQMEYPDFANSSPPTTIPQSDSNNGSSIFL